RHHVVLSNGTLLCAGDCWFLPLRANQAGFLQSAKRGIDGAARELSRSRDLKPVPLTRTNDVEHERANLGQVIGDWRLDMTHFYVGCSIACEPQRVSSRSGSILNQFESLSPRR